MAMKPKTQRQAEKTVEKKKLSAALRQNLMRRKQTEEVVNTKKPLVELR